MAISVKYGYGMHKANLTSHEASQALFWWYLAQVFYKCVTWPTKFSILLMYRRVFGSTTQIQAYGVRFATLVWTAMGFSVACFVAFETAGILGCLPVARSWDKSIPGTCTNSSARFYAYVSCNFVSDLFILAMPMPLINKLNVNKRQKYGLMAVFALGGL